MVYSLKLLSIPYGVIFWLKWQQSVRKAVQLVYSISITSFAGGPHIMYVGLLFCELWR